MLIEDSNTGQRYRLANHLNDFGSAAFAEIWDTFDDLDRDHVAVVIGIGMLIEDSNTGQRYRLANHLNDFGSAAFAEIWDTFDDLGHGQFLTHEILYKHGQKKTRTPSYFCPCSFLPKRAVPHQAQGWR